ncbi:MAG: mechanosensitive ion channel family protein [Pirellulaceae bacterium]|nr:mechanosensitive ion channel family protein [Pirellulaceae bacterium]
MKRHFLAHLGTILIVALLAAAAAIAVKKPDKVLGAVRDAWYSTSIGEDGNVTEHGIAAVWKHVEASQIFVKNDLADWMLFLAAVLIGLLAGKLAASVLGYIARFEERRGWTIRAGLVGDAAGPVNLAMFTIGLSVGVAMLDMREELRGFYFQKAALMLYTASVVWYLYNLIDLIDLQFARLRGRGASKLDSQLVPLLRRSLRVVLIVMAAMFTAESIFGQPIGTWLAGLGIAGLAISLAAQDSLKNFFGSITILLDRPFKVGERINCVGYDGVIEDIGFRSTKIRTLTGHLVNVPNANIVNSPVENIGSRPFIRRNLNLTITYDTPREKIAEAVAIVKRILVEDGIREPIHPRIKGDDYPPRVFFNDYNADSLNLFIMYWYAPPVYWEYMEHAERLNLRIFEEFEAAGIDFAFPTQTVYLAGDEKRKLAVDLRNPA